MKRISIFDLQEGKVYNAFDGERQLSKRYTVQNGKLMNANAGEDPNNLTVYDNCDWVPLKASINFKEVKGAIPSNKVSLLAMKEGTIYSASSDIRGYVARKGNTLIHVDSFGRKLDTVRLATIGLGISFTPVGKVSAHTKAWETRRSNASR